MRTATDPVKRFNKYVDKTDSCWVWTGFTRGKGYGGFQLPTGVVSAHRFAYETLVGPIPEGAQIDHVCMNKLCVNPKHLEPVTNEENQYRAYRHRGHWPIESREPAQKSCTICGKEFSTIFYEIHQYCSNACRCKAKRLRKLRKEK